MQHSALPLLAEQQTNKKFSVVLWGNGPDLLVCHRHLCASVCEHEERLL